VPDLALPLRCRAKVRYRQADQDCRVEAADPGGQTLRVTFDQPQRAITPGQYVAFYDGDVCLGGARIEAVTDTREARHVRTG
jgi:tRNA-specific 2-thiouridylase